MKSIELICFDVDGTLVKHPEGWTIWEVLNVRYGGTHERNRARYEMYKNGDITYEHWVRLDVEDWIAAGATRAEILDSVGEFRLVAGARNTIDTLNSRGFKLAVISGTLDCLFNALLPEHPFEDVYTNKIFFDPEGRLSAWQATPFDVQGKPDALRTIADRHGVPLERSAFIGDGDNDVPLLDVVGYFVAYHPKSETLRARADQVLDENDFPQLVDIFDKPRRN